ncbi:MAG: nucleotidyltransferase family protein [Deltaproteobacteria bacterium]|jgi:predicted nucleotidyltransferase|nr:nucleotidyltransferase family protein [Deltaproteobacteria bacterium]MCL5879994.1 nucleotidyltransferase family protein [Deltaproteobacteria bacterium]MDA8304396.1 nucleotidyltransferase family protein [Deltaproteobacteria bacterium]
MKSLNDIKNVISGHKAELQEKYYISEIGIFGSYVRGEETPKSDVDILVEFEKPVSLFAVSSLENYLSDLLGVKVDVVRKRSVRKELKENILKEVVNL